MSKSLIYSVLGVVGIAAGVTTGLLFSNTAQTNAQTSTTVNTSQAANADKPFWSRHGVRDATVRDALDRGDYEAWKKAIADKPNAEVFLSKIDTQDKFNKLVEADKIMKDAREKADKIRTDLGLPLHPQRGEKPATTTNIN